MAVQKPDLSGQKINGYEIIRLLGSGGFGSVYLANEIRLQRSVALKVLHPHRSENAEFVARFEIEARAAAQIHHASVVTIYRVGEDDGYQYIAMEYIKGRELNDLIRERKQLGLAEALEITAQTAGALAAAHDLGILHRDIKPQNIMLDERGRVKVTDFGVAKIMAAVTMTETGQMLGTPAYMSPEQCQGIKPDQRTDIYSLGVVLYEMLAGHVPFMADNKFGVMLKTIHDPVQPIQQVREDVPDEIMRMLNRMLAKDPSERFAHAVEVEEAIREFHASQRASVHDESTTQQLRPARPTQHFDAPEPLQSLYAKPGVGFLVLAAFVGLLFAGYVWQTSERRRSPEPAEPVVTTLAQMASETPNAPVDTTTSDAPIDAPTRKPHKQLASAAETNTLTPVQTLTPTSDPTETPAPDPTDSPTPSPTQTATLKPTSTPPPVSTPATSATLQQAIGYYSGTSGKVDEPKAKELFEQAAESGDPLAKMWLARHHFRGQCGFAKNEEQGEKLAQQVLSKIEELAEQGNAEATFLLASARDEGIGLAKDTKEAMRWYRNAAEAGHAHGMNNLGVMYANGEGVEKDDKEAVRWYRKAADAGHLSASWNLGLMYDNGEGVEKDDKEAVRWYRKAADAGEPIAMTTLGLMYANGEGVEKDDKEAVRWYRKAAEAGHAHAMNNLGAMYDNGEGVEKDDKEAVRWFRKAAEAGEPFGMSNLGAMYGRGEGVEKDDKEAVQWYRKAAEAGEPFAMTNLASRYEFGIYVTKDLNQAISWYQKAARLGQEDARKQLVRLGKTW